MSGWSGVLLLMVLGLSLAELLSGHEEAAAVLWAITVATVVITREARRAR